MVNGATKFREFKYMNKSKLLASTMLVSAATLMAAGSASAAALKLGGFAEFWFGVADGNNASDASVGGGAGTDNDWDVKTDMEIFFLAEETLANGIKVGARLEMEAGNGNDGHGGGAQGVTGFDESFGWVKTKFGQLNLGNNDPASAYIGGISVVGPVGIIKSDAGDWIPGFGQALNNTDSDLGTGDAQNVTYFTPKVAGAQVIVSYTPDSSNDAGSDYDDAETTGFYDVFSGAIKYGGSFGKVKVALGAGATHSNSGTGTGGDSEKNDGHAVRGAVTFGPATITGAYAYENLGSMRTFWAGGARVSISKMDRVSLGVSYSENEAAGSTNRESTLVTLGYERNVGKGIKFAASGFWGEDDRGAGSGTGTSREGVGLVGGFRVGF